MEARHEPNEHRTWPVTTVDHGGNLLSGVEAPGWNHLVRAALRLLLPMECPGSRSRDLTSGQWAFRWSPNSSTVIRSTPGAPLLRRTRASAFFTLPGSTTASIDGCSPAAGRWGSARDVRTSVPWAPALRASPFAAGSKASSNWMFCRLVRMSVAVLLTLSVVRAFAGRPATMPSADFCAAVTGLANPLSPGMPDTAQTSRGKTDRLRRIPAGFTTRPFMAADFAIPRSLVRPGRPRIRFLCIGSRLCSALPSDPVSRRRPCASLTLRRHRAG